MKLNNLTHALIISFLLIPGTVISVQLKRAVPKKKPVIVLPAEDEQKEEIALSIKDDPQGRSKFKLEQERALARIERKQQLRDEEYAEQLESIKAKAELYPKKTVKRVVKIEPEQWVQETLEEKLTEFTSPDKITYNKDDEFVEVLFDATDNTIEIDFPTHKKDKDALLENIRKGIDNFARTIGITIDNTRDEALKKYLQSDKFKAYKMKQEKSLKPEGLSKALFKKINAAYNFLTDPDYIKAHPTGFKNSRNGLVTFSKTYFNYTPA